MMKNFNCVILLCCILIACKSQIDKIVLVQVPNINANKSAFIMDYDYSSRGGSNKDSLMVNFPLSFKIINNSNDTYKYLNISEGIYESRRLFFINEKRFNTGEVHNDVLLNPKKTSRITYYFQTQVSKKDLETDANVNILLNDEKLGDSILVEKFSPYIQQKINNIISKDMFTVKLKNNVNGRNYGLRYCFNKNTAVFYDVDSLVKANPRYMFSCEKDFY